MNRKPPNRGYCMEMDMGGCHYREFGRFDSNMTTISYFFSPLATRYAELVCVSRLMLNSFGR